LVMLRNFRVRPIIYPNGDWAHTVTSLDGRGWLDMWMIRGMGIGWIDGD